ncbi:MBL fold metallo-hydrolase [bacterium]|nr:MBL fold metallo-hydrolase [bacterium]
MISKRIYKVIPLLLVADVLIWIGVYDLSKPQLLEVCFFDVGQGDSIFIETPQRHQILIDGGPDSGVVEKLGREMSFFDKSIDLLILTHPEHDHMGGLIDVLDSFDVENILWTGVLKDSSEYNEWKRRIQEEGSRVIIAKRGQYIRLGDVFLFVLWPEESVEDKKVKNINNTSVVSRLVFGKISFLFEGDVYRSVEKKLLLREKNLKSTVLKVAHHGSKSSTDEKFLKAVLPEVAVIEVGKDNPYGHPHQETLEKLEKYGMKILRTDLNGDIKIFSDGLNYKIK